MTNAQKTLKRRLAGMTIDQLVDASFMTALASTNEQIVLHVWIDRELHERMSKREWADHCAEVDTLMEAVA